MILLIAFCVVITIQLYFYLFLFRKYTTYNSDINTQPNDGVSVVIAAKNEAVNLPRLLSELALQDYPLFEIVLVNDASEDATLSEMHSFQKSQNNAKFTTKIISLNATESKGKKHALSLGIEASSYEYLVLTDADCTPVSSQWIGMMSQSFSENHHMVLGYGAYAKIKGSWLNKLIRFETLLTALQYFSYAIHGKPYMGVGRNLAYKKTIFNTANGFKGHAHISSGDDDLFVSQVANSSNVAICDDSGSFTISQPHVKFRLWVRQKRRHITTANHYKKEVKWSLGLFFLSQLFFYTIVMISLITDTFLNIILLLAILRFLIWYSTLYNATKRLQEKDLLAFGPLYEISIIFIQLYIFFKNIISPPKYW